MLAIETSQHHGSVAGAREGEAGLCEPLEATRRSDVDLLPAIDRLARRLDVRPEDLAAVAVSIGPGGFTGVRVGITAARMLGELGATLVPVPSALVAAEALRSEAPALAEATLVLLASKVRGDEATCWCAIARALPDDRWSLEVPGLRHIDEVPLSMAASDDSGVGARVTAALGDEHVPAALRARIDAAKVEWRPARFEALHCLEVARRLLVDGATVEPAALAPLYPRPPEAVTLWEARLRRAGQSETMGARGGDRSR